MEDNKDMEQKPKKRGRKPKVENKVEEKVENKVEDKIENKVEDKVENKVEDKVEKNQTMDFMNMMTPEMMQYRSDFIKEIETNKNVEFYNKE